MVAVGGVYHVGARDDEGIGEEYRGRVVGVVLGLSGDVTFVVGR